MPEHYHDSEVFDTGIPLEVVDTRPEEDFEGLVQRMIEEAIQWREENLDPDLEEASKYYKGEPYGDEQEGRSRIVTTEVRDVVHAIMPSMMRVFAGSERVVEFKPYGPEDVEIAEQQTDYINYVVMEDNPGFLIIHNLLKDAFIRRMGIVKWWWEQKIRVEGSEHTGLSAEQVEALAIDPSVEVEVLEEHVPEFEGAAPTFDVVVSREYNDSRARIAAIPSEEFIYSPSARSLEDARLVGHVRDMAADDLIAMGVPDEMIEQAGALHRRDNVLEQVRRPDRGAHRIFDDEQDEATRPIRFAEVYVRLDMDDDGIAELRKIQIVGEDQFFTNEVVDDVPFAIFAGDPEPHTMVGLSVADLVKDIQRIKSQITRGMLDSLVQTLNPSQEVVETGVNMKDVLNQEVGRIIRVRQPGQIREITTPFVGGAALPVLEYADSVKEDRVGISKAAAGLDADALQSSTKAAVAATISAAQQRVELFARMFAETGMKDLMRGLLRLVVRHQDEPRTVRLRNRFVRVDPRHWDADMDVVVNVALGVGLVEEKLQMLSLIADKQEQLLAQGAPLVSLTQLRSTYARMVELAGFRNSDEFFLPFGPEDEQQFQEAKAQAANQKPPEVEALLQIEMAKIQARQQEKMMEMQLQVAKLELERERVARDLAIREADVDRKSREDLTDAAIDAARLEIEAGTGSIDALKKLSEVRIGE